MSLQHDAAPRLGAKVLIRDHRVTGQLSKAEPFPREAAFLLTVDGVDGEQYERLLSTRVDYIDDQGHVIGPVTARPGAVS